MDKQIPYLALDPGQRNGYAIFDRHGKLEASGIIPLEDLDSMLEMFNPIRIIFEDYRFMPFKKQGGSNVPAAQAIGVIKAYAKRHGTELVAQSNTIKDVGYRWAGIKKPKGHAKDDKDAIVHGIYYLQNTGIIQSRLVEQ